MILKRHVLTRRLQTLIPGLFLGALWLYALWSWLPFPANRSTADHDRLWLEHPPRYGSASLCGSRYGSDSYVCMPLPNATQQHRSKHT